MRSLSARGGRNRCFRPRAGEVIESAGIGGLEQYTVTNNSDLADCTPEYIDALSFSNPLAGKVARALSLLIDAAQRSAKGIAAQEL